MSLNPIEEIKNRLDIVEVVSSYLKIEKVGANYRSLCPFHPEKTPSFFVSPAKQIWHCFGCSKGGDIFKFVMEIEGVEFGDALRILAQRAGVELKKEDFRLKSKRKRLYEICEIATRFFEKQLQKTKGGNLAKEYLLKRGISEPSFEKWRLGFAPNTKNALCIFLESKGYKKDEIQKAGLGIWKKEGFLEDRFKKRIIFPIFDLNSQVIGFGARVLFDEQEPKYLNTPNNLLYDKSRVLYGLNKAKLEIRKKDFCLLVEGYTDVICSHQAGIENVVATCGTALNENHLKILKRYSQNLFLAFDMDKAGDSATKRAIQLAQSQGFNLKVVMMPQGKDPAEVATSFPKKWKKMIKSAKEILDFYFEKTFGKYGKKERFSPQEKIEISKELLPFLASISNKILQSHWISLLSQKIQAKEEDLMAEMKKYQKEEKKLKKEKFCLPKKSRKEMLEEELLFLVLKFPKLSESFQKEDFEILPKRSLKIIKTIQEKKEKFLAQKGQISDFKNLSQKELQFLNSLFLKNEIEENGPSEREFQNCWQQFKKLLLKEKLEEISLAIKEAERKENYEKISQLIEKFNQISKKLL